MHSFNMFPKTLPASTSHELRSTHRKTFAVTDNMLVDVTWVMLYVGLAALCLLVFGVPAYIVLRRRKRRRLAAARNRAPDLSPFIDDASSCNKSHGSPSPLISFSPQPIMVSGHFRTYADGAEINVIPTWFQKSKAAISGEYCAVDSQYNPQLWASSPKSPDDTTLITSASSWETFKLSGDDPIDDSSLLEKGVHMSYEDYEATPSVPPPAYLPEATVSPLKDIRRGRRPVSEGAIPSSQTRTQSAIRPHSAFLGFLDVDPCPPTPALLAHKRPPLLRNSPLPSTVRDSTRSSGGSFNYFTSVWSLNHLDTMGRIMTADIDVIVPARGRTLRLALEPDVNFSAFRAVVEHHLGAPVTFAYANPRSVKGWDYAQDLNAVFDFDHWWRLPRQQGTKLTVVAIPLEACA